MLSVIGNLALRNLSEVEFHSMLCVHLSVYIEMDLVYHKEMNIVQALNAALCIIWFLYYWLNWAIMFGLLFGTVCYFSS